MLSVMVLDVDGVMRMVFFMVELVFFICRGWYKIVFLLWVMLEERVCEYKEKELLINYKNSFY